MTKTTSFKVKKLNSQNYLIGLSNLMFFPFAAPKEEDSSYDVLFDEEFLGGLTLRCSPNRAYRMPPYALVNLSHGQRKETNRSGGNSRKPTAVVKPQTSQHGQHQANNPYSNVSTILRARLY